MDDRLKGIWHEEEENILQNKYIAIFKKNGLGNKCMARIATSFLVENQGLLIENKTINEHNLLY